MFGSQFPVSISVALERKERKERTESNSFFHSCRVLHASVSANCVSSSSKLANIFRAVRLLSLPAKCTLSTSCRNSKRLSRCCSVTQCFSGTMLSVYCSQRWWSPTDDKECSHWWAKVAGRFSLSGFWPSVYWEHITHWEFLASLLYWLCFVIRVHHAVTAG